MSTRASIIYDEKSGVHIYDELLDDNVYIEVEREGVEINIKIMPFNEWVKLGLPNIMGLQKLVLHTTGEKP